MEPWLRGLYDAEGMRAADSWAIEELGRRESGLDTWLLLRIHAPFDVPAPLKRSTALARHTIRRNPR